MFFMEFVGDYLWGYDFVYIFVVESVYGGYLVFVIFVLLFYSVIIML